MRKILALVFALLAAPAFAQGTFPLNNIPLGKGPGKTGFTALAPGANGTCLTISAGVPTFGSCGSLSPGGSDTQIQYNNAGAFGGLTNTQVTARINAFTSVLSGAVPASGGGTTNFLRADGAFAAPPGGTGDLVGPGSAVVGDIPLFSSTTGKVVADSGYKPSQVPGLIPTTATVTISNGANASVTWAAHGFTGGEVIFFCTTGALPTGLTACVPPTAGTVSANTYKSNPTLYYVCYGGTLGTNNFAVATTLANAKAGSCVTTSSAGSGTHTAFANAMACAGCVGEMIWNTVEIGGAFNLTSGSAGQVWNSYSLPAGIWKIWGNGGVIGSQIASSATVGSGGSGYSAGPQVVTVLGGTCTTQPQFNVTGSAGAITSPSVAVAGNCTTPPTNPASLSGGGGTGGTLNVTYTKTAVFSHMHAGLVYGFSTIPTSPYNGVVAAHITSNDPNGWEFTMNPTRIFLTGTTTVNGVMTSDFTVGPAGGYGQIWAEREK